MRACLVLRNDERGRASGLPSGCRKADRGTARGAGYVRAPSGQHCLVSTGRLAGLIWDGDQPQYSRASLHAVVARLREPLWSQLLRAPGRRVKAIGIYRRLGMPAADQVTARLAEIGAG